MNEKTILKTIRKYALWTVLGSAALLLILELLKVWNVIDTVDGGSMPDLGDLAMNALMGGEMSLEALSFSPPSPNVWGHIEETLAVILGIGVVVMLALLVNSRTCFGHGADAKDAAAPAKAAAPAAAKKAAAKPKK